MVSKDILLMKVAVSISALSKDRSTQVGCLIVGQGGEPLSWGYNGFPRGFDDEKPSYHERPFKYAISSHAEENAVSNAARSGHCLKDSKAYITSLCPCNNCTRMLIQSGVRHIYLEEKAFHTDNDRAKVWLQQWEVSKRMLDECRVNVEVLPSES